MSYATLADLLNSLEQGIRLLLPSERAARKVNSAFDDRQRARGLAAWEPAQALSWAQWTRSLWSQLILTGAEKRLLLNPLQEHDLWRQIVADFASLESIASIDALATLAHSAWQLAAAYRATSALQPFKLRQSAASQDSRVFAEWADAFTKLCAQRELLSPALLEEALLEHLRSGRLSAPPSILLAGFSERTPAQQRLLTELQAQGTGEALRADGLARRPTVVTECDLHIPSTANPLCAAVVAANESEEMLLAVRWVRQLLQSAQTGGHSLRIAMLLPNPAQERASLEPVLRQILTPELQSIHADPSSTPWEFSSGSPLASLAILTDAMELVRWAIAPLSQERVTSLLLSPYVGDNGANLEALDAAARFDVRRLRRLTLLRSEISIPDVLEQADQSGSQPGSSELLASLRWLRRVQEHATQDLRRPREYAEWMEFIRELVRSANWPGNRPLTAAEFAAAQVWEDALDTVSTLDYSGRRTSFEDAWQALEFHLQRTTSLPVSPHASLQILSVAEAEASVFDAAVLLRFTDANWPENEQPHPLLPWALQRSLKMPGTDPAATAARSRGRLERLLRSTANILFTCAAQNESGHLRPSPFLETLPVERLDAATLFSSRGAAPALEESTEAIPCQTVADDEPLPPLPPGEVIGGASVLRLQAACGFLAFAQLRLASSEVEHHPLDGTLGLDAGERGTLLHRALQNFWKTVASQERLRGMRPDELQATLIRSIDAAIPRHLRLQGDWDQAYLSLLKQRLGSLLRQWLTHELERGPFRILDVELQESVAIGPLTLDVRIDRIDQVQDGVFLVDYKTGSQIHTGLWDGDRPDDPQLPLYALLPEAADLQGLAFAWIRAGEQMNWVGFQAQEGVLPPSTSRSSSTLRDMASLQQAWSHTLARLAEEFAQGKAQVLPKSYNDNCVACAQRLLCRINRSAPSALHADSERSAEKGDDLPV